MRGAKSTHAHSTYLIVCVELEDGTRGYGEVSGTKNWSGEDAGSAESAIKSHIGPSIVGSKFSEVAEISHLISGSIDRSYFTKAGVNMAIWDAAGKFQGLPVHKLLGGKHRSKIPVKISISGDGIEIDQGIEEARRSGFSKFKVKVGHGRERDLPRFQRAREILGPNTFIGADANGGWTFDEAEHCIDFLKSLECAFIEQPVAKDLLDQMAELNLTSGLPVIADESVFSLDDARRCIELDAADGVSVYIGKSGGLDLAMKISQLCAEANVDVIIGSNAELGIGTAAQIHVAAAISTLGKIPSDIIGHHFYTDDIIENSNHIDGTFAYVSDEPGLGVTPRPDIVERLQ